VNTRFVARSSVNISPFGCRHDRIAAGLGLNSLAGPRTDALLTLLTYASLVARPLGGEGVLALRIRLVKSIAVVPA
jgi:hypothetical protein